MKLQILKFCFRQTDPCWVTLYEIISVLQVWYVQIYVHWSFWLWESTQQTDRVFFTLAEVWAGTFWQEKSPLQTVMCSLEDVGRIKSSWSHSTLKVGTFYPLFCPKQQHINSHFFFKLASSTGIFSKQRWLCNNYFNSRNLCKSAKLETKAASWFHSAPNSKVIISKLHWQPLTSFIWIFVAYAGREKEGSTGRR